MIIKPRIKKGPVGSWTYCVYNSFVQLHSRPDKFGNYAYILLIRQVNGGWFTVFSVKNKPFFGRVWHYSAAYPALLTYSLLLCIVVYAVVIFVFVLNFYKFSIRFLKHFILGDFSSAIEEIDEIL